MIVCVCFFFFKQKTAYEMRISDWSSDVCSSDLQGELRAIFEPLRMGPGEYVVNVAVMAEGGYDADTAPIYFTVNPKLLDHHTRAYVIKVEPTIGRAPRRDRVCPYV